MDSSRPPGQTFLTGSTPPTPAGYPLTSLYVRDETGTGSPGAQTYTLRIYEVIGGTNAALLTSYVSTNTFLAVSGDWIRWEGLTNVLRTNAVYAFSLARNGSGYWKLSTDNNDSYPDGESVLLPTQAGGMTYGTLNVYDAAFVVGLTPPKAPVEIVATAITPSSCYAGQTVTMSASFSGARPMYYRWQFTDTGNVTSLISGATNATYTVPVVSSGNAGTYSLLASNALSGGSYVSSTPATLTVLPTPATFVMDFSHPDYSGAGVIGSGTAWNRINVSGGATTVNGTAVTIKKNTTMLADDGYAPLGIQFTTYQTWEYGGGGGTIPLLNNWMLLQGTPGTALFPFTFSNCIPGVYNLVLYGANGAYTSGRTVFTVNGVSKTNINNGDNTAFAEGVNYARFYNIAVTNGVLTGYWSRPDTGEAAFNGAQLELAYPYENPHLFIASQPASRTNLTGTPASFSVVAQGPGQLGYQWRSNSVPIVGATNSSYSAYTGTSGVWSYDVIVANDTALSLASDVATLTVVDPNNLVWRGYTADWDLISANWSNLTTTADNVVFTPGDVVLFDDTATSFTVALSNTLAPKTLTVSNLTQDYLMSGSGSLSGAMNLTKTANGTLTISNYNSYTGGTIVNGGTLALAVGGGSSSIRGTLNINPGGTVNLTAWDALGYTLGACVSTVNVAGGTLTNSGGNEGYITTFNLTGGTMSSGGGAYHLDGASGVGINSLASATISTVSAPVTLRSSPVVISTAQGPAPNGVDLDISGAIGGGGNTITKSGPGTLSLSGINTYNGLTTVSNGTLLVNGTVPGAVTVGSGAVIGGNGTIGGVVTVQAGGTIGAGASVGVLTLNSSPVLGGTVVAEINGTTPANDLIAVVGNPVSYSGTLVVSNIGGALTGGQKFTLFTATGHTGSFASIVGSPGNHLAYSFSSGVLSVGPSGPAYLTNSVSGSTLSFSWPAGQGWRLQMQTNSLSVGLGTNWVYVTDGSVTSTNITIDPRKPTVFYRLRYP